MVISEHNKLFVTNDAATVIKQLQVDKHYCLYSYSDHILKQIVQMVTLTDFPNLYAVALQISLAV